MRTIEVSTDVFAKLWAFRAPGEDDESAILLRIFSQLERYAHDAQQSLETNGRTEVLSAIGKPTWALDLVTVLRTAGGKARLSEIYENASTLRKSSGRSVPVELEATVRRTLENHSSDSHNYRGGPDLFCMPNGKGAGIWALRNR